MVVPYDDGGRVIFGLGNLAAQAVVGIVNDLVDAPGVLLHDSG